jgi:hypothetical protein
MQVAFSLRQQISSLTAILFTGYDQCNRLHKKSIKKAFHLNAPIKREADQYLKSQMLSAPAILQQLTIYTSGGHFKTKILKLHASKKSTGRIFS